MILDDVCPIEERATPQAGRRGANWEAGAHVCSDYGLDQSCGTEKADSGRNSRISC